MRVAVLGAGPMAQGLCALATRSGAISGGLLQMRLCSRKVLAGTEAYLDGLPLTPLTSTAEALQWADIVVMAVPASAIPSLCAAHGPVLATKILVDISNPSRADIAAITDAASASGASTPIPSISPRPGSPSGGACGGDALVTIDGGTVRTSKPSKVRPEVSALPLNVNSAAQGLRALLSAHATMSLEGGGAAKGGVRVVKALNNVSAYTLIHSDPLLDTIKTVAASDCAETAAQVKAMLEAMGVETRVVPTLAYAARMEGWHRSVFADWHMPVLVMGISFTLLLVFSLVRYNTYDGYPYYQITMWITNKALGWTSLWGMLYCYLPGLIISYIQLLRRVPSIRLWPWVQRWMDARKQLGLLSLLLCLLHLALSTYLWMPAYYAKLWTYTPVTALAVGPGAKLDKFALVPAANALKTPINMTSQLLMQTRGAAANATTTSAVAAGSIPSVVIKTVDAISLRSRLNWQGESSMLIGILAGFAMCLTGLTSLPHISHRLNWGEWTLAQSWLGWFSFCAATSHTLILGVSWWPTAKTAWPAGIPTITLLSTAPCVILICFKLVIALPPVSWVLWKIRSGAWGSAAKLQAIYVKRG